MSGDIRILDSQVREHFKKYKQILVLLGARQVGKTTLLKRVFPRGQYLLVDNEPVKQVLETYDIASYKQILSSDTNVLIIDEIHLLSDPGRAAKIFYDQIPGLKLIITGSSSLNIKNKTSESLAGRRIQYELFPLTFSEYLFQKGIEEKINFEIFERAVSYEAKQRVHLLNVEAVLENVLLFGLYPEMLSTPQDIKYLTNLADSVIFKDILDLKLIDNRSDALNVLKLLAYQIGNLVNYSEISGKLGVDMRTVKRYVDIFEQSFLIFRIYPYSTTARDEIGKSPKIYFYDTGLRNALIKNFEPLKLRPDSGFLFENFIISEVVKANYYKGGPYEIFYWRTTKGAEVDLVLKGKFGIVGKEIKYGVGAASKVFSRRYPDASVGVISLENFY